METKKKGGLGKIIIIVVVALFAIGIIGNALGVNDDSDKSSSKNK